MPLSLRQILRMYVDTWRTSCYALDWDNMAAEKGSCIATLVLLTIILVLLAPMDGSFVVPHKYPLCKQRLQSGQG